MFKVEAETNVFPKSRAMALYRESNSHGYIGMIAQHMQLYKDTQIASSATLTRISHLPSAGTQLAYLSLNHDTAVSKLRANSVSQHTTCSFEEGARDPLDQVTSVTSKRRRVSRSSSTNRTHNRLNMEHPYYTLELDTGEYGTKI